MKQLIYNNMKTYILPLAHDDAHLLFQLQNTGK